MSESSFNKKLRQEWECLGIKIDRIESHALSAGIPDNHCRCLMFTFWVEMKENEMTTRIKYEPNQALWLETEWKIGGMSLTLLHVPSAKSIILVWGNESRLAEKDLLATDHVIFPMRGKWQQAIFEEVSVKAATRQRYFPTV